jgi:hypothetical protein
VTPADSWSKVTAIGIGGFQSSATTVTARVWQPGELQPWLDLSPRLEELGRADALVVERQVGGGEQP